MNIAALLPKVEALVAADRPATLVNPWPSTSHGSLLYGQQAYRLSRMRDMPGKRYYYLQSGQCCSERISKFVPRHKSCHIFCGEIQVSLKMPWQPFAPPTGTFSRVRLRWENLQS